MISFIRESAIPISLVSLLTALPNTQLTRRLAAEGRLHPGHDLMPDGLNDTCGQGLNFETIRPQRDILLDYTTIVRAVFEPAAYCDRLRRLARLLDRSGRPKAAHANQKWDVQGISLLKALVDRMPGERELFWRTFVDCASANPAATRYIMMLMVLYLHLGPFARTMAEQMERTMREMDRGAYQSPQSRFAEMSANA
jgi:hypothetical protein